MSAAAAMTAGVLGWIDRHARACIWALAAAAVALRLLLAVYSPWSFGYVWDLYHEAIQRLYADGRLPASTDCWECWQPPLLFLASWPLYALGRAVYPTSPWPDDYALRFVGMIPLVSGLACLYYTYRLLRLTRQRGPWLVIGLGIAAACPLLFFSTYGIEPDILLAGLFSAFIFYLMQWHLHPADASPWDAARLGVLAGLAAATKYNGLTGAAAGAVVIFVHAFTRGRSRDAVKALAVFVAATVLVGGWKYADNAWRYGTPFFANGDAASGFSLTQRMIHTHYEFTTFRLASLLELTRPDAPDGMLDELPVYRSVWTTLHGLTWSDMGFFTNPTRHGTRYPFYRDRHVPSAVASDVLVLGMVPSLLAMVGFVVTSRRRAYLPLTLMSGVGWLTYLQYLVSQEIWAVKAKYLLYLFPIYVLYAAIGLRWVCRAAPGWASATVVMATIALIFLANLYLLAFALG